MPRGARKPLYEAETACQATVCVTGGTGYIAGAVVERLLAAGHTVHVTCRDPGNAKKLAFLRALPRADQALKVFKVNCDAMVMVRVAVYPLLHSVKEAF